MFNDIQKYEETDFELAFDITVKAEESEDRKDFKSEAKKINKSDEKYKKFYFDGKIVCNSCGKLFNCDTSLSNHIRNMHRYEHTLCKICGKSFDKKKSLENHYGSVHKSKQCLNCHQMFKGGSYRQHMLKCKTFMCHFCDFETKIKKDYTKHKYLHREKLIKKAKKKKNKIYCSFCSFSSFYSSSVKKHENGIHGDKIYCDICDKNFSFRYSISLEKHKESMHSAYHKCSICDKLFYRKGSLDRHLEKKHSENVKIVTYHNCGHCDYRTPRRDTLKRHMITHLNPKRPKLEENKTCETCNFTFTRSNNLSSHLKKGCQGSQFIVIF